MAINTLLPASKANILAEALPYIQSFHSRTFVIKYGGNAMTDDTLKAGFARDIALLQLVGMRPVIVHGGGPQITGLLERMGVKSEFRRGMRVTDAQTLEAVEMATAKLNQEIVGLINRSGGKAVGLSGQDGHFIQARKLLLPPEAGETEPVDIGAVGEIERVDPELINLLQSRSFVPVVMPIGVGKDGDVYNINADLVAGTLARSLNAEKLILMTNTPGVLSSAGKLIPSLTLSEVDALFADGTLSGGMLPKIGSALDAVRAGVKSAHIIDGRVPNALLLELLTSEGIGTLIRPDGGPHFLTDSQRYFSDL